MEESRDGRLLQVCQNCGTVVSESSCLEPPDEFEGRRVADQSHLRTSRTTIRRQINFRDQIAAISEKVKLAETDRQICRDQGKILLLRWTRNAQILAASLVFIACRKHRPCITYKEFSDCIHVDMKKLARGVKICNEELKKLTVTEEEEGEEDGVFLFRQTDASIRTELEQLVVRLDLKMSLNGVVAKALNLFSVLRDEVKVMRTSQPYLCAVTMFIIQHQAQKKICKSDIKQFAEKLGLKPSALQQRILDIRKALLHLAKKIPTLEDQVISCDISVSNVENYISTILDYQWLLTRPKDQHTSSSDDVEATPTSSTNGAGNVSLMAQKWVPPDDDIPLESDALDVDEYINTEDEVKKKEQFFLRQEKEALSLLCTPKKCRKPSKHVTPCSAGQP